jgi:hypothetical protein
MCYKKTHKPERITITFFHRIAGFLVTRLGYREIFSDLILIPCLALAWRVPLLGGRFLSAVEKFGVRLSERKTLALISLPVAAILLRLSLLWLLPIPVPLVHDEFAHLLAGDTFAHGRLTNPTHPMWVFFDTVHVNQSPTYMSKYPPAQGAVLALGQLLGHPWFGVVFSIAVMCAAVLWMLQGWLPPRWALLGGVLVLFRLGISTYWINGYWGGAVPAIGGALVVGAMPRIIRFRRTRDALILALGAAILANSRPVEGLVICVPVMTILFWWLCNRNSPPWRETLPKLILPFCGVALLFGIFIGYYNWRLTGNALLFPEALNERTYSSSPDFIWQQPGLRLHYLNAQFEFFYNGWARDYWSRNRIDSLGGAAKHAGLVIVKFTYFFMWPELCLPLVIVPWMVHNRRVKYLFIQLGLCFLGWFSPIWFLPHYASPATAIIFVLLVQAIRHLRRWEFHGKPVGIGFSRIIVLFALVLAPFHQRAGTLPAVTSKPPTIGYRAQFEDQLSAMPGEHLAIVRYGPVSNDSGEWVYNAADIDRAKVVWAREIPSVDMHPLLNYFRGRRVWLVEPDARPPRMSSYSEIPPS